MSDDYKHTIGDIRRKYSEGGWNIRTFEFVCKVVDKLEGLEGYRFSYETGHVRDSKREEPFVLGHNIESLVVFNIGDRKPNMLWVSCFGKASFEMDIGMLKLPENMDGYRVKFSVSDKAVMNVSVKGDELDSIIDGIHEIIVRENSTSIDGTNYSFIDDEEEGG